MIDILWVLYSSLLDNNRFAYTFVLLFQIIVLGNLLYRWLLSLWQNWLCSNSKYVRVLFRLSFLHTFCFVSFFDFMFRKFASWLCCYLIWAHQLLFRSWWLQRCIRLRYVQIGLTNKFQHKKTFLNNKFIYTANCA